MRTSHSLARRLVPLALSALLLTACGEPAPQAEGDRAGEAAEAELLSTVTEEGPVKATVELAPLEPRLGDALTLTLTVEAQPGVTVEMPAFGFTPRERTEPDGRSVQSQRYTLQAPMSGRQRIPPLRIEFLDQRPGHVAANGTEEYRELLTDELAVTIVSVLPDGAVTDELRPVRASLAEPSVNAWRWLTALAALGIVAAMAGLSFYLKRLSVERARVTAYDRAIQRMAALEQRGFPSSGEADAWYVELSDIVRHYLEDRYGVRAPELTTEEFLQEARGSAELTGAHRELLSSFLERCDQVKFAAYHPEQAESQDALASSRRFLDETRLLPDQDNETRRTAA